MIKIMCPSCLELLEVDDNLEKVYCTKCFKNISVEQGKKYLASFVNKHIALGHRYLDIATEYQKAREEFEKVIQIDSNNVVVVEGLIKSTLLMSTVRNSFIKESMDYLSSYRKVLQKNIPSQKERIRFIEDINEYLNLYLKTLEERLNDGERFYELEGKNLYLNVVKQIKEYKQKIIEVYFANRIFLPKSSLTMSRLKKEINILSLKENTNYGIQSSPFHLLNSDIKECYINDQVFKDNRKLYKGRNNLIVWGIIFLSLLSIGIVLIMLLPNRLLLGVPIAGVGLLGTLILLICRIVVQKKLK